MGGRAIAAIALVLAIAVSAGLLVLRRDEGPPKPAPPPLKAADPSIELVDPQGPVIMVRVEIKNVPDTNADIERSGLAASAIGRALARGVSDDLSGVKTVRLVFAVDAVDRFGHDLMATFMTLDYSLQTLKAAAAAPPAQLLGLADTVRLGAPGAYDATDRWCADKARADARFCAKAGS